MIRNPSPPLPLTLVLALALLAAPAAATDRYLFDSELTFDLADVDYVYSSAAGDLDNDGHLDYLFNLRDGSDYLLRALPGRGDGTFDEPVETVLPESSTFKRITLHDLDSDSVLDLLMTLDDALHVFEGLGDGTFSLLGTYEPSIWYAVGDFDNDGHPDIAGSTSEDTGGHLSVLYGNGDGTFADRRLFLAGEERGGPLVLDDFDGDGNLDAAINCGEYHSDYYTYWVRGRYYVFLGRGDRTFEAPAAYGPDEVYYKTWSADLDGDQRPELLRSFLPYGELASGIIDVIEILPNNGDGTFGAAYTIESTDRPDSVSAADLDGDGWTDLAAMGESGAAVHLGDGAGGFIADLRYPSCAGYSAGLTDLDEDGCPDLLTMSSTYGRGSILFGKDDGRLGAARSADMENNEPLDIAAGDFDDDGHVDLAVIYRWWEETWLHAGLVILSGDGTGEFTVSWSFDMPDNYLVNLISVDLNHDLIPDLVGGDFTYGGTVSVFLCNGDGTFSGPTHFRATQYLNEICEDLTAADFDGDGHPDLAVANGDSNSISVVRGHGDGTFAQPAFYTATTEPVGICTADFNGDNAPDLATANVFSNDVSILINDGSGAFPDRVSMGDFYEVYAVATADLDRDGDADVAALTGLAVHTLINAGDGSFSWGPDRPVDMAYASSLRNYRPDLLLDDFNRDEVTDLVVAYRGLQFCPGEGGAAFGEPLRLGTALMRRAVAADLDGDGGSDLAAPVKYASHVCILLSQTGYGLLAAGPGPGPGNPPLVRLFHPGHASPLVSQWLAYGAGGYGVNVAFGRLDDSGAAALVTGPGPGQLYGPHVRAFRLDGTPVSQVSFLAYGTNRFGVNVACGDIDGDGYDELVTGAGPGAVFGPHVRGWDWDGEGTVQPLPEVSFMAYGTPKWGVNVCCGDIDGDGRDELVTGAGPGQVYGPHVRAWDWAGSGSPVTPIAGVSYFAYGTLLRGVNVSCGDIDGDGIDEIVTGPGPGPVFGPHVRGWNWDGEGTANAMSGVSFFAYDGLDRGVDVSCGDIDNDGIDEILTGPGPGPEHPARVRGWNYDGQLVTPAPGFDFSAYDPAAMAFGVNIAAPRRPAPPPRIRNPKKAP